MKTPLKRMARAIMLAAAFTLLRAAAEPPASPATDSDAKLRARYAVQASRFADLEGEPIHYADEGTGPAIVLLHGSFGSLLQWNGWAKALKHRYRIIRLDLPPAGLSGPSPRGDYSVERKLAIIDALTRRLGVDRFVLVATSSSAIPGTAYAADHPERVLALVYSNASVGKAQFDTAHFSPALKRALAEDATHKDHHTPDYWRQILLLNFVDPAKVTPALVAEWTELNNRALQPAFAPAPGSAMPSHDRTIDDLARIRVPALVLWSANDGEATLARDGQRAYDLLGTRDKTLAVVPRCGHMIALECSAAALAKALPFLDRVTRAPR